MIVLEGPDGSGKSTLAQQLSAALNIAIHHSGGPPRSPGEIIDRQVRMNESLRVGTLMIYDRAPCISDPIYGPVVRGGTPFEAHPYLAMELRVRLRVPIIYCRPPLAVILENIRRDGGLVKAHETPEHVAGVMANAGRLIANYDWAIGDYPHWVYDWTGRGETPPFSGLVAQIRRRLAVPELVMG